eukprot:g44237.t1
MLAFIAQTFEYRSWDVMFMSYRTLKLESGLKNEILASQKLLEIQLEQEKQMKLFTSCLTMQEIFNQLKSSHQGLLYRRVPIPDCGAPREEGIPENSEEELVSVPDAKYTKGEFEIVMQIVRLLPNGNKMKKEVDLALDIVSETMTPMHYHLREIVICTYRQMLPDLLSFSSNFC